MSLAAAGIGPAEVHVPRHAHTARVRVLTLNLWGCRGDWPRRRRVLIAGLRELRPDLLTMRPGCRVNCRTAP